MILSLYCSVQAQTGAACGTKGYLDNLPVKPPKDPKVKRQIQLVNCSDQIILGAANAAHEAKQPPWPVFPQEGTWEMQPYKSGSDANVLTIDIPPQWYGQFKTTGVAPNFWVRTGCRYDEVTNRAQCETGGCGGQYDCSSANIGPPPATTLVEWTFYQNFQGYFFDSPDISAVNGANLTFDVSPRGGDDLDPLNPKDFHWLNWNYPLTVHGADLREPTKCNSTTGTFTVKRSDIDKTTGGGMPNYPLLGYVIVDGNGNPTMPAGNTTLACLSNCGKYKFPVEVGKSGCNLQTDSNCYFWTTFCAGSDKIKYGQECDTDAECPQNAPGMDLHVACFHKSGPKKKGACEIRAFYNGTVSQCNGIQDPQPAAPASTVACNNTYGSVNPLDSDDATKFDWADQPIVGGCSDVIFTGNGKKAACVGDDTLHKVLHGAYTWPNDPEVFQGDANVYRIVISPEGRGKAPITAAQILPGCDSLPANYMPSQNRMNCSIPINGQNAAFGIGLVQNGGSQKWQSNGHDWPCFVPERAAGDNGILCRWNPPPPDDNCLAPKTDQNVTSSACGRIDSGTALMSGSITPNSGDPLLLEVSIPKVLNTVSLPASVNGCVPSGMGAWTLITSKAVNSNQGIVAWYKGTSNTSVACNVTVTMAKSNPAELKVYDVPKFNGTVETMSTASGNCTPPTCAQPYTVTAGSAPTVFSNDLQLGAVLMVNQQPTPVTYWDTWLTNGANQLTCLGNNTNCPRDDGTDFLPGHGPYSANSDVGHNAVTPGTQYFHRDAGIVLNQSKFSWVGLALYIELGP
ncbi:MAG: thaumatin family protein [Candidatus Korobacteraceae bacterium]